MESTTASGRFASRQAIFYRLARNFSFEADLDNAQDLGERVGLGVDRPEQAEQVVRRGV